MPHPTTVEVDHRGTPVMIDEGMQCVVKDPEPYAEGAEFCGCEGIYSCGGHSPNGGY